VNTARASLLVLFASLSSLFAIPASTFAATAPTAGDQMATAPDSAALTSDLQKKMEAINEQHRELLEKVSALDAQRRELEMLLLQVRDLDAYRGGADTGPAPPPPPVVGQEQKQEKEAAENKQPELPRINADVGGVLTPQGRLVLEPSVQYLYASVSRLSIEGFTILPSLLIGVIDVVEADRDTYIGALTARYGLTNRLEAEIKGSYLWRNDSTRTRQFLTDSVREEVVTADGNDFGDVEFGLRYQFPRRGDWPFLTGNLRVKTTTGTDPFELTTQSTIAGEPSAPRELATGSGFWSVSPSVTFVYPSDPVVFFGNLGYLWTQEDDKGGRDSLCQAGDPPCFGNVDPGNAVRFNFGMGFSLNDRSSFSLSYSLDVFDETTIELATVPQIAGSDVTVGQFVMGYSLRLPGGGAPLNLSIGIGATRDAPDTNITFRLPFNFLK